MLTNRIIGCKWIVRLFGLLKLLKCIGKIRNKKCEILWFMLFNWFLFTFCHIFAITLIFVSFIVISFGCKVIFLFHFSKTFQQNFIIFPSFSVVYKISIFPGCLQRLFLVQSLSHNNPFFTNKQSYNFKTNFFTLGKLLKRNCDLKINLTNTILWKESAKGYK